MLSIAARLGSLGFALGLLGCGDDGFTPTEDAVAGTYTATTFIVTNTTPPTDLLALGMTLSLTLAPDGTTTGRLFMPDGADNGVDLDEDLTGTWTLSGRSVTFDQAANTFVRQARVGRGSARALSSSRPDKGSVDLCGRGHEGLQLMRKSLGRLD